MQAHRAAANTEYDIPISTIENMGDTIKANRLEPMADTIFGMDMTRPVSFMRESVQLIALTECHSSSSVAKALAPICRFNSAQPAAFVCQPRTITGVVFANDDAQIEKYDASAVKQKGSLWKSFFNSIGWIDKGGMCGLTSSELSRAEYIVANMAGHLSIRSDAGNHVANLAKIEGVVERVVRENVRLYHLVQALKREIEVLKPKAPPRKSLSEIGRDMFNSLISQVSPEKLYTVAVVYVDEFNKQDRLKPIISDIITALSKELQPLRGQGGVAYNFIPQSASDELRKDAHLVILLGMKTTERIRMIERRAYGELGKFFCTDSVDRRYVLLATTGMPSTQNVMGLDNDEVREKIPSDQMIRHNMSTLFMSGADSKNLKSCDMNATAIYDVCKWMLDVTSKL
ncbi:hypothetical protein SeLEV6574_g07957 [Synchytrium endobioticum]|uniref:Uncharacterized protein n=2 Tax=Synchytrium endobioticum TaxID=286115 RepID=A0A507C865_9FUNG|nr:hypothetical protein SeLEV6574_g07957 [Synchytrium endobioticum]